MEINIPTPDIGDILKDEFLEPYNLNAYRLAQRIHVPPSRILEILHGKRKISIETGLKLARLFGTSESFFIRLQSEIDIRKERSRLASELDNIQPIPV